MIGQGAAASLATLTGLVNAADSPTLPSTGGTAPLITSADAGVVLASSNSLHGFNVGNTGGAGISGDGFGNLTEELIVAAVAYTAVDEEAAHETYHIGGGMECEEYAHFLIRVHNNEASTANAWIVVECFGELV